MLKRFGALLTVLAFLVSAFAVAGEQDRPKAEALVKKAIEYFKANGKAKTFAEISKAAGSIRDEGLYVFVYDTKGNTVAHGGAPSYIGTNQIGLKDVDGKEFIKAGIELAVSKGEGWSDYKFNNPKTKTIDAKSSFLKKEGDYIFGCGIYK